MLAILGNTVSEDMSPLHEGGTDMPNLFALMSDGSDHPIAGDKLRGNDEGPYRRP